MSRSAHNSPRPWLRSVEESIPRDRRPDRRPTVPEAMVTIAVFGTAIAVIVWLLFFSSGGIGVGSV